MPARVTAWDGADAPDEESVRRRAAAEGLRFYAWDNAPGDRYPAHSHAYHKIIYVARGSIRFGLPLEGRTLDLHPGDRLDLPAGVVHEAVAGAEGVLCYEAHSSSAPMAGQNL